MEASTHFRIELDPAELHQTIKSDLEVLSGRAGTCAVIMAQPEHGLGRVYDWETADRRLTNAAVFLIESAEFINDVDHHTNQGLGGTEEIQGLAHAVRQTVREFMANVEPNI